MGLLGTAVHRLRRPVRGAAVAVLTVGVLVSTLGGAAPAQAAVSAQIDPGLPRGIDVSRWQSTSATAGTCASTGIDWSQVRTSARSFVFIRATVTSSAGTRQDPCFARNWAGAEAAGVYRGAYHYAIPSAVSGSAVRDARAFVAATGRTQDAGDLPPVLDLEVTGGLTPAPLTAWAGTWLATVRSLTGRLPVVYTMPSFWERATANSAALSGYPLWIAHWTSTSPRVPGGWRSWTFWQHSAQGRVAGIGTDVDLDVFNGSASALRRFAHPATQPTSTTTGPVAYLGQTWRVAGNLRSGTAPVTGAGVRLYRRLAGSTTWTVVATTRTIGTTAAYGFDLSPTRAATYRVRFSGNRDFASSWSAARTSTVRARWTTRLTSAVSRARVAKGGAVTLSGRLTRSSSGLAATQQNVRVLARTGSGPWTLVTTLRTSSAGAGYRLTLHPRRSTTYRVTFAGSRSDAPTASAQRRVAVR